MSGSIDRAQICELLETPFSDEQLDAVTAPLAPGVIIAGAGTGKTTVMAARVVWLVATGQVRPDQVLGLTFTRKAAGELGVRVAAALETAGVRHEYSEEAREVVATYDSFAARLVGEYGLRLGMDAEPRMLDNAGKYRLASRVVAEYPGPLEYLSRLNHRSIPALVLDLDAQLQSNLADPARLRSFSSTVHDEFSRAPLNRYGNVFKDVEGAIATTAERLELLDLVEAYQRLKRQLGYVDYSDQLRRAVELATGVPAVGASMRSRFAVVLLDEYQDTSAAQVRLLNALFSGADEETGRGFPVTAVGDPHQAIYAWRGAAATNILGFQRQFPDRDGSPARRFSLQINRRSGTTILSAGNALARDLSADGAGGVALVAPEQAPAGAVEARVFNTFDEEIAAIVGRVIDVHTETGRWSTIAVLTRTNKLVGEVFTALRERDIPAEISGLGGLMHLPEIAPVVAMLRVLDAAAANSDVVSLLSGPRWNLGLRDLEALGSRAVELAAAGQERSENHTSDLEMLLQSLAADRDPAHVPSLLEAAADPRGLSGEGSRRVREFVRLVAGLRRGLGEPLNDLVRRVVAALGVEVELRAETGETTQLSAFIARVGEYCAEHSDESLNGLLAWLDAEEEFGDALEQAGVTAEDSVKLMTVHRAKGLEWDTVLLPGMSEKHFPSQDRSGIWPQRASLLPAPLRGDADGIPQLGAYDAPAMKSYKLAMQAEHLRSETRLAYVAATRAKRLLIASTHVWMPGNKTARVPSRYLSELGGASGGMQEITEISEANPVPHSTQVMSWPVPADPQRQAQLLAAADLVTEAQELLAAPGADPQDWVWGSGVTDPAVARLIREWDDDAAAIMTGPEGEGQVVLPMGLSATMMMAMRRDPQAFARELVRPMPREPSRSATRGSHFHSWVQQRFALSSSFEELDSAPPRDDLAPLIEAFESGQFAQRQPLGIEVPFLLRWGSHVLRGRIDAAYRWDGMPYKELVVDWKTSTQPADPLQLAVYRLAWAEARGLSLDEVGAGFYHVLSDELRLCEAPASLIEEAMSVVEE